MSAAAEALWLDTPRGRLAALAWGAPEAPPVLALHGWLDNAHSWLPIAPLLHGIRLVALDFPGHGLSAHRPPGMRYHLIDYIDDVLHAADALGWSRMAVLGHSLGGAVAVLAAVAAPSRITRVASVEALGPLSAEPDTLPAALLRAHAPLRIAESAGYADLSDAVRARQAVAAIEAGAAELLLRRSMQRLDGRWVWRSDPRLRRPTALRMDEAQVLAVLGALGQPLWLLSADPLPDWIDAERYRYRLERARPAFHYRLPGGHHLHMEQPAAVAERLLPFLHGGG